MEDNEFRDLQEQVQLVSEMAQTPGWELLLDRARVDLFRRQERLINGQIKTYDEYVQECAWMDGASFIMNLPQNLQKSLDAELEYRAEMKRYEEEDEEDA